MPQQSDEPTGLLPENPYLHRGPIKDRRYFYGRAAEIRQAFQMLRHGQCVSIVGPRRIGKTSFLFHLCDPDVRKDHNLGEKPVFIFLDGQWMGDLDKSEFYQLVWQEIRKVLVKDGGASNWPEGATSFREFHTAITVVQEKGYRLILLFDEFGSIATNSHFDKGFFSQLRSLPPTVAYVIASANSLGDLTYADRSVLTSPFFGIFQETHLGFLKPQEAKAMVSGLAQMVGQKNFFTEKDLQFLFQVAGYHPLFLQVACYYLFERKVERKNLIAEDYGSVRRQYTEDVERHFQYTWDHLGENERKAVRLVDAGRIKWVPKNVKRKLERKCVLYSNAIFSSVFAEFVKAQTANFPGLEGITKTAQCWSASEAQGQALQEQHCHLDIMCTHRGQIHVRLSGALSYQGGGTIPLDIRAAQRYARRVADARRLPSWRFQVKGIGLDLYRELFQNQPEVLTSYNRAKGKVQDLRLRISLSTPREFLRLPFEALFAEEEMYLCLKHPLSRHVLGHFADREILSKTSIERLGQRGASARALLVASNTWRSPVERIPDVDVEVEELGNLLRQYDFDVRILSTEEATLQRVRDELERGNYCLFHYAGHGSYNADSPERSALYFWEGTMGQSNVVVLTAAQLEGIVRNTPLLFAYLSCCWGARAGEDRDLLDDDFLGIMDALVMGGVPAVLGFRWPVSDRGARTLARSFYAALLEDGKELDEALLHARNRLDRDEQDWFSPVLIMQKLFS